MLERIALGVIIVASAGSGTVLFAPRDSVRPLPTQGAATVISRAGDGLFHLTLELDGKPVDAILDTGATRTVIASERLDGAAAVAGGGKGTLLTFSGRLPYRLVTVSQVKLAGRALGPVDVAAIAHGSAPSVIGQDLIARLGSLRIEGDRMELR